ncbi:MAG: hypothetical protein RQ847_12190 [Wenzhouxiangellaceae bacterium]|nr:hypothetical protein [Wenzhouxiangellaceae bacterium]
MTPPPPPPTEEEQPFFNPYPESGMWFPNDGSGTGIILEVQDGILVGALFGADAAGDNTWLLFSGRLEQRFPTEDGSQQGWKLETALFLTTGSACVFDCPAGEVAGTPVSQEAGRIALEFTGRNEAAFTIDDGQVRPIAPFYFGVNTRQFNPDRPRQFLPDLTGTWVFAVSGHWGGPKEVWEAGPLLETGAVRIGEPVITRNAQAGPGEVLAEVVYPVATPEGVDGPVETLDDLVDDAEIVCRFERADDSGAVVSRCTMTTLILGSGSPGRLSFDDLTDSRFSVFSSGFHTAVETFRTDFIRLGHD